MKPFLFVFSALLLMSMLPPTFAEEQLDQSRFEVTVLATGMNRPMELAIAPDGVVYFIELDGKLRAYHPATRTITTTRSFS